MSGLFAWCASVRNSAKVEKNAIENEEDEMEDGVSSASSWRGRFVGRVFFVQLQNLFFESDEL